VRRPPRGGRHFPRRPPPLGFAKRSRGGARLGRRTRSERTPGEPGPATQV